MNILRILNKILSIKSIKLIIILILFNSNNTYSQFHSRCPELKQTHDFKSLRANFESQLIESERVNKNLKVGQVEYEIPVVVHVLHNNRQGTVGGDENSNISFEQIISQLDAINNDYEGKVETRNSFSVPTNARIKFFLATRDPQGNPTTGINRVFVNKDGFDLDGELFEISSYAYWDSKKYLNIWVSTLKFDYLGYGTFPYFPNLDLPDQEDEEVDGIFIDHRNFGNNVGTSSIFGDRPNYAKGRTLTHEVGHWLGLYHTWGDDFCGDDYVEDTPFTETSNSSVRCNERFSRCSGTRTRNLIENYMDYSPDDCMFMFTPKQIERMHKVLDLVDGRRSVVLNGQSMKLPKSEQLELLVYPNPVTDRLFYRVLIPSQQTLAIKLYNSNGILLYETEKKSPASFIDVIDVSSLSTGVYVLQISNGEEKKSFKVIK